VSGPTRTTEHIERDFRWILESEDGSRALMVTWFGGTTLCLFYCAADDEGLIEGLIVDNWLDEDQAVILASDNEDIDNIGRDVGMVDSVVRSTMPMWLSDFQADEITELQTSDDE
jgi:hypothetical protein